MSLRSKLIRLAHQQPSLREELLPLLGRSKVAADEIDLYALPPSRSDIVEKFESFFGVKAVDAWSGGFGYSVNFTMPGRMGAQELRKVLEAREIRWIDFHHGLMGVGM